MLKKLVVLVLAVTMLFSLAGCKTYADNFKLLGVDYETSENVFLNVGETIEIDFLELFTNYVPNIKKVDAASSDERIFTISGNRIKAVGMGSASLMTTVYDEDTRTKQTVAAVKVYVVNPSKMIEVKTAQDLVDISKNMEGAYILKSDIDLEGNGDWLPIAKYSAEGNLIAYFGGIFINPDGHKIKSLTINSAKKPILKDDGIYELEFLGLFASVAFAYIDGLILENVSIDTSAYTDDAYQYLIAGGICGQSYNSVIRNCTVDGVIVSQFAAGGIAGKLYKGFIIGCNFKGAVENTSGIQSGGAGGIAGNGIPAPRIIDCTVEAEISGKLCAGGILGHFIDTLSNYDKITDYIKGCSFTGELNAQYTGKNVGLIGFSFENKGGLN